MVAEAKPFFTEAEEQAKELAKIATRGSKDRSWKKKVKEVIYDRIFHNGQGTPNISGISMLRTVCALGGSLRGFARKVEVKDYIEGDEQSWCDLHGGELKAYYVIRFKKPAKGAGKKAVIRGGDDCITRLYQWFGLDITKFERFKKLAEPEKLERRKKELEEIISKDEKIREAYKLAQKLGDYSIYLRALDRKGTWLNWFRGFEQLPEGMKRIRKKLLNPFAPVERRELEEIIEFFGKHCQVDRAIVEGVIEDYSYFKIDTSRIDHLLSQQYITVEQEGTILSLKPNILEMRKRENHKALRKYREDTHQVLKEIMPLYKATRNVWTPDYATVELYSHMALSREEYGMLRDWLPKWASGMEELPLSYEKNVLLENMLARTPIKTFKEVLAIVMQLVRKTSYAKEQYPVEPETLEMWARFAKDIEHDVERIGRTKKQVKEYYQTVLAVNTSDFRKKKYVLAENIKADLEEVMEKLGKCAPALLHEDFAFEYGMELPKWAKYGIIDFNAKRELETIAQSLPEYKKPSSYKGFAPKVKTLKDIVRKGHLAWMTGFQNPENLLEAEYFDKRSKEYVESAYKDAMAAGLDKAPDIKEKIQALLQAEHNEVLSTDDEGNLFIEKIDMSEYEAAAGSIRFFKPKLVEKAYRQFIEGCESIEDIEKREPAARDLVTKALEGSGLPSYSQNILVERPAWQKIKEKHASQQQPL